MGRVKEYYADQLNTRGCNCVCGQLEEQRSPDSPLDFVVSQQAVLEVAALRAWIIECRDEILYPLAHQDTELGRKAECLGAATPDLLAG